MNTGQMAKLILILLSTILLAMILTTAVSAWNGTLSDSGRDRIWVLVGSYMTGMFTIIGTMLYKLRDEDDD